MILQCTDCIVKHKKELTCSCSISSGLDVIFGEIGKVWIKDQNGFLVPPSSEKAICKTSKVKAEG